MITKPITNLAEQLNDMADGFNDCPVVLHSNDIAELKEILYAAARAIEAKQQGPGEAVRGVCKWSQQDEGYEVFSTSCGHEYEVNDGSDGNVRIPFCPFCARRIEGSAWTPGDDAPQVEAKRRTGGDHG